MKEKHFTTSSGKNVYVYDDVFTYQQTHTFYDFFDHSLYSKNNHILESVPTSFLQATFSKKDWHTFNMETTDGFQQIAQTHFNDYAMISAWIVLTTYMTSHITHSDSDYKPVDENGLSMLYYGNLEWLSSYGGETLFANDLGEYERVVEYKPNRVVVFDSSIPHKVSPITAKAPPFRYSLNVRFLPTANLQNI